MTSDLECMAEFLRGKEWQEWPVFLKVDRDDGCMQFSLSIYSDIKWFQGHFVDQPVLPGVAQIQWAVSLANAFLLEDHSYVGMDTIKFKKMILPDNHVYLKLCLVAEKSLVKFSYFSNDSEYSSGNLRFSERYQ